MVVILNNKDKLTDNYKELFGQCTLGGTRHILVLFFDVPWLLLESTVTAMSSKQVIRVNLHNYQECTLKQ